MFLSQSLFARTGQKREISAYPARNMEELAKIAITEYIKLCPSLDLKVKMVMRATRDRNVAIIGEDEVPGSKGKGLKQDNNHQTGGQTGSSRWS